MKFTELKSFPADHPIYSIGAVVGGQRSSDSSANTPASRSKGGWAKADDPIYKQGWTIAPNMAGRARRKSASVLQSEASQDENNRKEES